MVILVMSTRCCHVSDKHTIQKLCSVCSAENRGEGTISPGLESMLFNSSPTQVLYNVEVSPGTLAGGRLEF